MKNFWLSFSLCAVLAGCAGNDVSVDKYAGKSLATERKAWKTTLVATSSDRKPADAPPAALMQTVKYPAPSGQLTAYLSNNPLDGNKRPAIVWITGGDCNSIGDIWSPMPADNDQSAAQIRAAGVIMMFPSLRGGNDNPGRKEGFLGEVDDVLAAADYLAKQPFVDPTRIYLGGHSTGGTLALLVAETPNKFRGVFAFGAVGDVSGYGADSEFLPFDTQNRQEIELRSPIYWMQGVQTPTYSIEATGGNIGELQKMKAASTNPKLHFIEVRGADHFSVLAPSNDIIGRRIFAASQTNSEVELSEADLNGGK